MSYDGKALNSEEIICGEFRTAIHWLKNKAIR